jgi:hypothetical protein
MRTVAHHLGQSLVIPVATALMAACAADSPLAPSRPSATPQLSKVSGLDAAAVIATIQRATARYHNLDAAIADGFVFLHDCETRPEEGPAGTVYVNLCWMESPTLPPRMPYSTSHNGMAARSWSALSSRFPTASGRSRPSRRSSAPRSSGRTSSAYTASTSGSGATIPKDCSPSRIPASIVTASEGTRD